MGTKRLFRCQRVSRLVASFALRCKLPDIQKYNNVAYTDLCINVGCNEYHLPIMNNLDC
jgi:hypothetical protein